MGWIKQVNTLFVYALCFCSVLVYCNFLEYIFHRFILHRYGKNKQSLFRYHWEHHIETRRNCMKDPQYTSTSVVMLKELLAVLILIIIHTPTCYIHPALYILILLYAVNYFRVHKKAHIFPEWATLQCRWHIEHHLGNQDKNFNIVFPLFDYIFRTREKMSDAQLKIALRTRKWF